MIFGKYINRYYLKHAPVLLLGLAALLTVDYIQLLIPQLYRLVINGVNLGQVVVRGETMPFTKEVLFQHICLPMIWIVLLMVVGRFLWRICFFGTSIRVQADLREKMFDHSRRLSQQYYQVNKVGNLMSLYTNDLDTIQECFGDGILMFFDALVLGLLALYRMWCMDRRMTMLALIPAAFMFAIGTVMGKTMTKTWEKRQQALQNQQAQNGGSDGGEGATQPSGGTGVEPVTPGLQSGFSPIWPLPGVGVGSITGHFGDMYFNGPHNGLDIGAGYGTPIVAAQAGEVISAQYHWSWGNNVLIWHNETFSTRYAHMSSIAVSAGQYVEQGQIIGYVGSTGESFGNHLHFEVYYGGSRVDPDPYLGI